MIHRLIALIALGWQATAQAQCPQWDPRFHVGFENTVLASCVFDDGGGPALYVAGNFTNAGAVPANRVARWDGASWTPLGAGIGGSSVTSLAVFDDGGGPALYAAGQFTTAGGIPAASIAKWNGTSWSALGLGISGHVLALASFDDGSGPALYAGGNFFQAGGVSVSRIARWNGASWSALGAPGSGVSNLVLALAAFDDGSGPALYVGGQFTTAGGISAPRIARWNGGSWSALGAPGSGMNSTVWGLGVFDDGTGTALYAGGDFATAGGVTAPNVARWNGSSWSAVGSTLSGVVGTVVTFAAHDDGSGSKLYIGGNIVTAGGVPAPHVARWNGSIWAPLAPGSGTSSTVWTLSRFDDGSGDALYAGGDFTQAGGVVAARMARWDGASWSALNDPGQGLNNTVRALETFDDGNGTALYVAGSFTLANNFPAARIARWDGASWSSLSAVGVNGQVNDLAVFDDGSGPALYAGGSFNGAGGAVTPSIARWDGASWTSLGSGMNSTVYALVVFDDGSGPALYAGGGFTTAGGVAAPRVARWDGASWSAVGAPGTEPNGAVQSFGIYDDGSGPVLYAGGLFTAAGGEFAPRIAKWDGTSWSAIGPGGSGMNERVLALHVFDDGTGPALYAGGAFGTAGGVSAPFIARWNGTSWSALGAIGSGMNNWVHALTSFDDGSGPALYAGGLFTTAGGVPAARIARWNGTTWSAVGGSGMNLQVWALGAFDDGADESADLYVGGDFTSAGGLPSWKLAQWHGCRAPVAFCFGDGSGAACPCSNSGAAGRGCDNSSSSGGALLTAAGTSVPDTLVLSQSGELATSLSIVSQGDVELATPVFFGDGLRCVGGALKRLYTENAVAGSVSAPGPGDLSISARSAELGDPLSPGDVRFYYVYYRDPDLGFCPSPQGNAFNVGNALRVVW